MSTAVLGELPLVPSVSTGGDAGVPVVLGSAHDGPESEVKDVMREVARKVYGSLKLDI